MLTEKMIKNVSPKLVFYQSKALAMQMFAFWCYIDCLVLAFVHLSAISEIVKRDMEYRSFRL